MIVYICTQLLTIKKVEIMKTNQILAIISGNGGYDNFNRWTRSEVAEWVEANFNCSKFVANRVANQLV